MNPPAIQKLGSAVLLQGPAVADTAYLISVGLRALQRRDGVAPMSRWLVLQRQLRAVADLADTGNAELPQDHDEASLGLEDLISTAEAAEMLKVTEPQMRNLVSQFGGRRAGRAWVFDRALVELEAKRRVSAQAA